MNIRELLLGGYFLVWAVVVVFTLIKTGGVPSELWAVLGVGLGSILAVFRGDEYVGKRRQGRVPKEQEPQVEEQT